MFFVLTNFPSLSCMPWEEVCFHTKRFPFWQKTHLVANVATFCHNEE